MRHKISANRTGQRARQCRRNPTHRDVNDSLRKKGTKPRIRSSPDPYAYGVPCAQQADIPVASVGASGVDSTSEKRSNPVDTLRDRIGVGSLVNPPEGTLVGIPACARSAQGARGTNPATSQRFARHHSVGWAWTAPSTLTQHRAWHAVLATGTEPLLYVKADRLTIPFAGPGSGAEPVGSYAQHSLVHRREGRNKNRQGTFPGTIQGITFGVAPGIKSAARGLRPRGADAGSMLYMATAIACRRGQAHSPGSIH